MPKNQLPPEALAFWQTHPVEFVEDAILQLTPEERKANKPFRRIEPEQKWALRAVNQERFVSIRTGHSLGKTCFISWLILWFLYTRPFSKVLLTGAKFDQIKMTTWAELNKWLDKSLLHDKLKTTTERIYHVESPKSWFGQIVTAKEPENIAGFHGEHILVVVDEASAESIDSIADALMGCVTQEDNHLLLCGNPTRVTGLFHDSHTKSKKIWFTNHFSSEKSRLVEKSWLEAMATKYNRDSDNYRVRVLGDFPLGNPLSIISLSDCESARNREVNQEQWFELGVDPALEGNDLMTIAVRSGYKLLEIQTKRRTSPTEQLMFVLNVIKEYRQKLNYQGLVKIKVDKGGGYGSALIEFLSLDSENNLEVIPITSNAHSDRYKNYGTEMWFHLADIIHKIELPNDSMLIEELSAREQRPAGLGVIGMESKADFKKRLGRSPDRADACVLAFADGPKKVFQRSQNTSEVAMNFDVDWNCTKIKSKDFVGPVLLEASHYAAIVLSKDLSFCCITAIYQHYIDHLWIYGEIHQSHPDPDKIKKQLYNMTNKGKFNDSREAVILGNERMFKKQGERRPLADILRDQHMAIIEPEKYDEFGAIAQGVKMFNENSITIHESLHNARSQIDLWTVKEGKPESIDGFISCFLLIMSEVRQRQKETPSKKRKLYISQYSGKPWDYRNEIETQEKEKRKSNQWMLR